MTSFTLVYKGSISVEHNPNTQGSLASRFERGYVRVERHRGMIPELGLGRGELSIHDLHVSTEGSDDQYSEAPVDAALTGFLDRHKDILSEAIETEIRRGLPRSCHASVQLSFWRGSVAFAATITLLLVGKYVATREAMNFLTVALGPPISRSIRSVVTRAAGGATEVAVTLGLEPSSVAEIERYKKRALRPLDRFDRQTKTLAGHVYYRGLFFFVVGMFAMLLAIIIGVSIYASWGDVLKAILSRSK